MSSPQYQVLARKCRPQRFSEIVGQEHITRTLQNAIKQQRVGHAYLFVGSRGIGKTTSARIFAKALNCEAGVVTEPCCECQSCKEIAAGTSLDVIEIDGASHNKVEHIRDIRDNVQYTPARGRYKIYIIDEVHMLTTQAWNALLKTLEEPPPHVKFFFATTEPHKVLPTIVSRCQRFDLKRLSVKQIAGRLREIAATENVPIDDGAIVAIARAADGGMRDAQSIFDQIIAFCGGAECELITEAEVINVFGLASGRELAELTVALLGNKLNDALAITSDLAERGRDLERFYRDLVLYVRNVMVAQVCPGAEEMLDVSQAEQDDLFSIAKQTPADLVRRVLEALVGEEASLRAALNKRVYLEVALVKVVDMSHSVRLDDVIGRLNQIREVESLDIPAAESAAPPSINLPQRPDAPPPAKPANLGTDSPVGENPNAGPPRSGDAAVQGESVSPVTAPAEAEKQVEIAAPVDAKPLPASADSDSPEKLLKAITESFRGTPETAFLVAGLEMLRPISFEDGILELAYPEDMPAEQVKGLQSDEASQALQARVRELSGNPEAKIMIKAWVSGVSEADPRTQKVSSPEVMERVKKNPFVQKTLDLFGGEIIDVRG